MTEATAEGRRESGPSEAPPSVRESGTFTVPVGKITQYIHGTDWENYAEQLSFYFLANDIRDQGRKKAVLLANVPADTYCLIKDLLAPMKPGNDTVTYDRIVKAVKDHVKPERSALVNRYEFDNRVRSPNECVADYVKSLKHLAAKCRFRDDMRSERLRDRLIAGIRDDRMLRSLLSEKLEELTFDKAVQKCVAIEQASKDVQILQGSTADTSGTDDKEIKQMTATSTSCYRCLGKHSPKDCFYKSFVCRVCNKQGHLLRACRSTGTKQDASQEATREGNLCVTGRGSSGRKPDVKMMTTSETVNSSDSEDSLNTLFSLKVTVQFR